MALRRARSWRWFRTRVLGLMSTPNTLVVIRGQHSVKVLPQYRSRLQRALAPDPSDD